MPNLAAISQATTEINRGVGGAQALTFSNRLGEIGLKEAFLNNDFEELKVFLRV